MIRIPITHQRRLPVAQSTADQNREVVISSGSSEIFCGRFLGMAFAREREDGWTLDAARANVANASAARSSTHAQGMSPEGSCSRPKSVVRAPREDETFPLRLGHRQRPHWCSMRGLH